MIEESSIVKYLSGNMSNSERLEFENLLGSDVNAQKELEAYQNIWEQSNKIIIDASDIDAQWNQFIQKRKVSIEFIHNRGKALVWLKVAATILLIAVTSFSMYYLFAPERLNEITKQGPYELADQSMVVLNHKSHLSFSKEYGTSNRKVNLLGEAFFNVKTQKNMPFEITLPNGQVRVLGTKFNVLSTQEYTLIELYEGKLFANFGKKQFYIKPGERWELINDQWITTVIKNNDPAWGDETHWHFENASLQYILQQLAKHFNVEFPVISNEELQQRYTINLPKKELKETLHLLSKLSNIPFDSEKFVQ
jgi:ferric-dicitrate binding protein FerR (iron transport regulator)